MVVVVANGDQVAVVVVVVVIVAVAAVAAVVVAAFGVFVADAVVFSIGVQVD